MTDELKLFTVCPECGGSGEFNSVCEAYACPKCDGTGYVPWTPKAAPLVWVKNDTGSWTAGEYFIFERLGGDNTFVACFYGSLVGLSTNVDSLKSMCQTHADARVYKDITGKELQ